MSEIHLDDLAAGQVHHLGHHVITREEIVTFARAYDPQSFHLDDEAAAASIYGGLIASGWPLSSVWQTTRKPTLYTRRQAG